MSLKSLVMRAGMKISKHSPAILLVTGIGVGVAAAVVAVKKTHKLHEVIKEDKESLKRIDENEKDPTAKFVVEHGDDEEPTIYAPYDKEVADNDRKEVARHMITTYISTYAVPVGMGLASVALILCAHKIMAKRLIAVTAAYNTTVAAFRTYRNRVKDRYGEEAESDIFYGRSTLVNMTEDEEGNVKAEEITTSYPLNGDLVLRFDSSCSEWRNDPMHIRGFLKSQEGYLNAMYSTRRTEHAFVTELTDSLGMERENRFFGLGWSKANNPDRESIDITSNVYIEEEDGEFVAYIDLDHDGKISI